MPVKAALQTATAYTAEELGYDPTFKVFIGRLRNPNLLDLDRTISGHLVGGCWVITDEATAGEDDTPLSDGQPPPSFGNQYNPLPNHVVCDRRRVRGAELKQEAHLHNCIGGRLAEVF